MISNSSIQTAWITKLKATSSVTSLLADSNEIREDLWKGTDFTYPNIRVKLGNLVPANSNPDCNTYRSPVAIQVYIEQKSSKQADDIAGAVATAVLGKSFTVSGVKVYGITLESLTPADVPESDPNSWMAVVNLNTLVSSG